MAYVKIGTLLALAASLVSADINAEVIEFQAILSDVNNHLSDYISLALNDPSFTLPAGVLDVYTQMTTYTDDTFTTLFSDLDFNQIDSVMTELPWYSSRLEPEIQSAFKANSITDTALVASATSSESSGSSQPSSAASSSSESSEDSEFSSILSSAASSISSLSSESSSASESSSSAAPSSSSAASSSASSVSSSVSSVSSSASSSASSAASSASSATSSKNGAVVIASMDFFTVGMGAVIAGAVGMLL